MQGSLLNRRRDSLALQLILHHRVEKWVESREVEVQRVDDEKSKHAGGLCRVRTHGLEWKQRKKKFTGRQGSMFSIFLPVALTDVEWIGLGEDLSTTGPYRAPSRGGDHALALKGY